MGMFDSAYIKVKCPTCGREEITECQTKNTDCVLEVWHEGDFVSYDLTKIYCIASCDNGCGDYYYLVIELNEGKLTGNYKIIERE